MKSLRIFLPKIANWLASGFLAALFTAVVPGLQASKIQSYAQLEGDQYVDLLPGDPIVINVTYGRTTAGTEWNPPDPPRKARVTVYLSTDANPENQDNYQLTFFNFDSTEQVTRNFSHTKNITVALPGNFTGNYYLISIARPFEGSPDETVHVLTNSVRVNIRSADSPTVGLVTARLGTTVGTADEYSENPSISNDGRYVVFHSEALGLVDGITIPTDVSGRRIAQIYIRDLLLDKTTLISQRANRAGNLESRNPQISPDGRYVVFQSAATNLVDYDVNNQNDIFVYGVRTGALKRISIPNKVFPATSLGSQGDYGSFTPSISGRAADESGNGYYIVTFESDATNFVRAGELNGSIKQDDTNGVRDIYAVRLSEDMEFEWIAPVSVSDGGVYGSGISNQASVSADAKWVVFRTLGRNLPVSPTDSNVSKTLNTTEIIVKEIHPITGPIGKTHWMSLGRQGDDPSVPFFELDRESFNPVISKDGRYVAFSTRARRSATGGNYLVAPAGGQNYSSTAQVWLVNRWFDGIENNRDTHNNMTLSLISQTASGGFAPSDAVEPIINGNARYVGFRTTTGGSTPASSMQPAFVTRSDGVLFEAMRVGIGSVNLTEAGSGYTVPPFVEITPTPPLSSNYEPADVTAILKPVITLALRGNVGDEGAGYTGESVNITIRQGSTIIGVTTVPVVDGTIDLANPKKVQVRENVPVSEGPAIATAAPAPTGPGSSQAVFIATVSLEITGFTVGDTGQGYENGASIEIKPGIKGRFVSGSEVVVGGVQLPSGTVNLDGTSVPNGTIPDGISMPDGTERYPNGYVRYSDGRIDKLPWPVIGTDPVVVTPTGPVVMVPLYGAVKLPDGTLLPVLFDDTVKLPDGTVLPVLNNTVELPNGTVMEVLLNVTIGAPVGTRVLFDSVIELSDGTVVIGYLAELDTGSGAEAELDYVYFPIEAYYDDNGSADLYIRDTGIVGFTNLVSSRNDITPADGFLSVRIAGGGGSGAEAVAIVQDGSVIRLDITNPGSGYTQVPTVTIGSGEATATALLTDGNELASRNKFGEPSGGVIDDMAIPASHNIAISEDGRYVAFTSLANNNGGFLFGKSNQWPLDSNGKRDIYLVDRKVGSAITAVKGAAPTVTITVDTANAPFGSSKFVEVTAFDGADLNETSGNIVKGNIVSVEIYADGKRLTNITETVGPQYVGLSDDAIEGENPSITVVSSASSSALWTAPLTAGYSQIYAVVTDNNGNVTISDIKSVQIVVPTSQRPVVTLAASPSIPDESEIGDPITIEVTATDPDNAIVRAVIYSNGHRIATWPQEEDVNTWTGDWSHTYHPSEGGDYVLHTIVTDASGNAIVSNAVSLRVKGTDVPVVTIVTPSHTVDDSRADDSAIVGTPVNFTITAVAANPAKQSINTVVAKILRNGVEVLPAPVLTPTGGSGTYTTTWTPTALDAPEVVFSVTATDNNGKTATRNLTIPVLLSAAGLPNITIQDPDGGDDGRAAFSTTDTRVTISAIATAVGAATITSVVFEFDGQPLPAATNSGDVWTVVLNPSQYGAGDAYTLRATAIDSLGGRKAATLAVSISDPLPTIVIKNPAISPYSMTRGEMLELLVEASTPSTLLRITSVLISVGDTPVGTANYVSGKSYRYPITPTEPGNYIYTATATDSNGKQAKASVRIQVHEPAILPVVEIISDIFYDIYGRSPTTNEIASLVGQVGYAATKADVAAALLSNNYEFYEGFPPVVVISYLTVMGTYPDYDQYIEGIRLMESGYSWPDYLEYLLRQPEYTSKYGKLFPWEMPGTFTEEEWTKHIQMFVVRTYSNLYGSKPKRDSITIDLMEQFAQYMPYYESGGSYWFDPDLRYPNYATALYYYLVGKDNTTMVFDKGRVAALILAIQKREPTRAEVNKISASGVDSRLKDIAQYAIASGEDPTMVVVKPVIKSFVADESSVVMGGTVGMTLTLSQGDALSFTWLCNGKGLPLANKRFTISEPTRSLNGQTVVTLTLADIVPADAASYTVKVSNMAGIVTSKAVKLAVLPAGPSTVARQATLTAGEIVSYDIADPALSGETGVTYYAKGLPKGLKIDKTTGVVSGVLTAAPKTGGYPVQYWTKVGKATSARVSQSIIVLPPLPPEDIGSNGVISWAYGEAALAMSIKNTSLSATGLVYGAKGLPKGLVIDKKTGEISVKKDKDGNPVGTITSKPGTYTVTYWSAVGSIKTSKTVSITIYEFPFMGDYDGLFENASGTQVTGKLTIKVAYNGAFTGKLYRGSKSYALKGALLLNPAGDAAHATLTNVDKASLRLNLEINSSDNLGGSSLNDNSEVFSNSFGSILLTDPKAPALEFSLLRFNQSVDLLDAQDVDIGDATVGINAKNVLSFKATVPIDIDSVTNKVKKSIKITTSTTGSDAGTWLLYVNPDKKVPNGYFSGELNAKPDGTFDSNTTDLLWNRESGLEEITIETK
jgi:hypothetical protein